MDNLFTGAMLLTILTYIGYQLKGFPNFIWEWIKKQLVYTVNIEESSELFSYFEGWLFKFHNDCFKNVRATLRADKNLDEDINKDSLVISHYTEVFTFKYNDKRLLITKGREKFENATDIRNAFYNNFKIQGWGAKKTILMLLGEVIRYNQSIRKLRQSVYVNNSYGDFYNFGDVYGKTVDNIIIDKKELIIDDIKSFLNKENWYIERGIPYKRGYLFYGSPGNGKTSFCVALSKYFCKHIQFLNLNDLEKDSSLFSTFGQIKNNSIVVIEDIDAVFTNRNGKSKISFSALLNCMDGAFSKHGVITIITTNHYDKIDSALIREGRIDIKFKVDNPDKKTVEEYLSKFYGNEIKLKNYNSNHSMAKIQEICLSSDEGSVVNNICSKAKKKN